METFAPKGTIHGPILPEFILEKPITLGAKIMYALLCDYASKKDYCWPSQATLADRLSCSVSSIKNYLTELVKENLVAIRKERRDERRATTYYYMLRTDTTSSKARRQPEHAQSQQPQRVRQQTKSDPVKPNFDCDQPNSGYRTTLNKQEKEKTIPPLPPVTVPRSIPPVSRPMGGVGSFLPDFEKLWEAYPKKEALEGARKIWRTMRKSGQLPSLPDLLTSIKRFMATTQWQKDHGRYIPQLVNFLKYQRWLDPLSPEEEEVNRKRLQAEQLELARKREEEAEEARKADMKLRLRPIYDAFAERFGEKAKNVSVGADNMNFGTWRHYYGKYHGPTAADVPDGTTQGICDFIQTYRRQRERESYYAAQSVHDSQSQSDNRERKPMSCADILRGGNFMARFTPVFARQPVCAVAV